jgi:orotidine-5'-phosphate decarboxylase
MTPAEAVHVGADYIVVGRPVLKAEDRREAVRKILEEISKPRTPAGSKYPTGTRA